MKQFKVSIVVPAYNEEKNLVPLSEALLPLLKQYDDYEIIFVNDGSTDLTLEKCRELHKKDKKIQFISFSRNFGHQVALKAGLDFATGDCVISMDADMQHPPRLIPQMVELWQKGNDVVYTIRQDSENQSFIKKLCSRCYYFVFRFFSGLKLPSGTADFRLLDRKVVRVVQNLSEKTLFLRGMIFWLGFKQKALLYTPNKRWAGNSHYTIRKMLALAFAGAVSFSVKPLRIATYLGLITAFLGCLFTAYVLYMKLWNGAVISGWASIMSVLLILGGVQLFIMGIIGEYIGLIFIETKKRPLYIVEEKSFDNKEPF